MTVSPYYNPVELVPGTRALAERMNNEFLKIAQAFDQLPAPSALNNGTANYTWTAWADSPDGTQNFSTVAPGSRSYIGFAVNRGIATPSQFPENYVWTRIIGLPGVSAPLTILQYSVDGVASWHTPFVAGDKFWRQSVDGGITFSPSARLSAATLAELDVAASTALAAAGADIVTLNSSVAAANAAIAVEASTRAAADSSTATQLSTLTSNFNANAAAITAEQSARATGDSANATSITNLTTTVNGHTSSISSFATSINGLEAKAGVLLDVNGYIVGWTLNNGSGTGEAVFRVDKFKVVSPNGLNTPFEIIGNDVFIKNAVIQNLAIGTDKISIFAIRKTYFAETAASVTIPIGSGRVRVVSVVVTKDSATSDIEVRMFMRPRPGTDYAGYFVLGANSGGGDVDLDNIWYWVASVVVSGLRSVRIPVAYFKRFNGYGAGTYTFYVDLVTYGGGTAGSFIEAGSNLLVEELKR